MQIINIASKIDFTNLGGSTIPEQLPYIVTNTASRKIFIGVAETAIAINKTGTMLLDFQAEIEIDGTGLTGDPIYWDTNTTAFTLTATADTVQVGILLCDGSSGDKVPCRLNMLENFTELDDLSVIDGRVTDVEDNIANNIEPDILALQLDVTELQEGTDWQTLTPVITATNGTLSNLTVTTAEYKVTGANGSFAFLYVYIIFSVDCSDTCDSIDIDTGLGTDYTIRNYYTREVNETTNYYNKYTLWYDGEKIKQADFAGIADQAGYEFEVSFIAKVEVL